MVNVSDLLYDKGQRISLELLVKITELLHYILYRLRMVHDSDLFGSLHQSHFPSKVVYLHYLDRVRVLQSVPFVCHKRYSLARNGCILFSLHITLSLEVEVLTSLFGHFLLESGIHVKPESAVHHGAVGLRRCDCARLPLILLLNALVK